MMNKRQQAAVGVVSELCKEKKTFTSEEFKNLFNEATKDKVAWPLGTVKGDLDWILGSMVTHSVIEETKVPGEWKCLIEL